MNIDVDLNKVTDILGDRIKSLELENALLKAALNESTSQIEQAQIQRLEDMAIPLPVGGPNQTVFDGSGLHALQPFSEMAPPLMRVNGDEKRGYFPDPGMPQPSSVVEAGEGN